MGVQCDERYGLLLRTTDKLVCRAAAANSCCCHPASKSANPMAADLSQQPTVLDVRSACRQTALHLAAAVVQAVNALPLAERTCFRPSLLKPAPEVSAAPDVVGEELALQHLWQLSATVCQPVHLVVDPGSGSYLRIHYKEDLPGGSQGARLCSDQGTAAAAVADLEHPAIWCYLDAVDGTLKLSGLFNDAATNSSSSTGNKDAGVSQAGSSNRHTLRLRVANDGAWAVGVAFTDAVTTHLQQLVLADFTTAAIVDGNPPVHLAAYPPLAVATKCEPEASNDVGSNTPTSSRLALEASGSNTTTTSSSSYIARQGSTESCQRLYTTSCSALPQCFAYMDGFQAHDSRTAAPGDPAVAARLHRLLSDRHNGGAFDVLRQYGNLGSLLRNMLGWRGHSIEHGQLWQEAQCGVFVVVNENLANLIPAVPIVLGAGGVATDFHGQPLLQRRLGQGRASVVYSANQQLHDAVMQLIRTAVSGGDAL